MSFRLTTPDQYEDFVSKFDTFLFDCDGVLWRSDTLVDGVNDVLHYLRSQKKNIIFVTNDASKSRRYYKGKFDKLGIQAEIDEIFGSAYASAVYLSSVLKLPKDKKVYVIGMAGLEEELREEGISYLGGTDPADLTLEPFSLASFKRDPDVGVVLAGLDTSINYMKLSKAFQYITRNEGCLFMTTNSDSNFPVLGGLLPGAGAIAAPLQVATKRTPLNIGKPETTMLDAIRTKHNYDPARTVMIGDRLDTDILFGQNGGLQTLLVMTGVTTEADLSAPSAAPVVPSFIIQSLGDLKALT